MRKVYDAFINQLMKQLKLTINKGQGTTQEENCILIMDNARMHRTDKIKQ